MKAVIMVGGKGTRIASVNSTIPKPKGILSPRYPKDYTSDYPNGYTAEGIAYRWR